MAQLHTLYLKAPLTSESATAGTPPSVWLSVVFQKPRSDGLTSAKGVMADEREDRAADQALIRSGATQRPSFR